MFLYYRMCWRRPETGVTTRQGAHMPIPPTRCQKGGPQMFVRLPPWRNCRCVCVLGRWLGASEGGAFGPLEELQALILN